MDLIDEWFTSINGLHPQVANGRQGFHMHTQFVKTSSVGWASEKPDKTSNFSFAYFTPWLLSWLKYSHTYLGSKNHLIIKIGVYLKFNNDH